MLSPQILQSITVKSEDHKNVEIKIRTITVIKKQARKAMSFNNYSNEASMESVLLSERTKGIGKKLSASEWDSAYYETLAFIKEHEGWNNGKAYYDAGGIKTIGYGHVVAKNEHFAEQITQKEAELLLQADFSKALRACDRETRLCGTQRLAIAHFIFAKGVGNFNKSKLKEKLRAGKDISSEILEWGTYRGKDGKTYHSEYSLSIRKWEIEMFNR